MTAHICPPVEERLPTVKYYPRLAIDPLFTRGQRTVLDDVVNKKAV